MKKYKDIHHHAIDFLSSFTVSDFKERKTYNKFRNYRSMHKAGSLTKGSYETVLQFLGYTKEEQWKEPKKKPDTLMDILLD